MEDYWFFFSKIAETLKSIVFISIRNLVLKLIYRVKELYKKMATKIHYKIYKISNSKTFRNLKKLTARTAIIANFSVISVNLVDFRNFNSMGQKYIFLLLFRKKSKSVFLQISILSSVSKKWEIKNRFVWAFSKKVTAQVCYVCSRIFVVQNLV